MDVARKRKQVDAADRALLRLLNKRMELAIRIGRIKRARGMPLHDPAREREILRRARSANGGPLDPQAVSAFYRWLLSQSRRLTARALRNGHKNVRKAAR